MSALTAEKHERTRKRWRRPKAVLRALGSYAEGSTSPFHKEEILDWLNAAAPMSVAKLIGDVVGDDPTLAQRAAMDILDRVLGKPRPSDAGNFKLSVDDGEKRLEITIVDPQSERNGDIIDAAAQESGADSDQ